MLTAHFIDENCVLHNILLCTTEMKDRHTAINLYKHINQMMADWGLVDTSETITINHNVTDMTNIYAVNNIQFSS